MHLVSSFSVQLKTSSSLSSGEIKIYLDLNLKENEGTGLKRISYCEKEKRHKIIKLQEIRERERERERERSLKQKVLENENLQKVQGGVSRLRFFSALDKLFLCVFCSWKPFGMSLAKSQPS